MESGVTEGGVGVSGLPLQLGPSPFLSPTSSLLTQKEYEAQTRNLFRVTQQIGKKKSAMQAPKHWTPSLVFFV